jgi:hypothetical protein
VALWWCPLWCPLWCVGCAGVVSFFKEEEELVCAFRLPLFFDNLGVLGLEELDLGVPGSSSERLSYHRFRADEFHRFFTAFSLRPGTSRAISDHLFPLCFCISKTMSSSSGVHSPFFTDGSK